MIDEASGNSLYGRTAQRLVKYYGERNNTELGDPSNTETGTNVDRRLEKGRREEDREGGLGEVDVLAWLPGRHEAALCAVPLRPLILSSAQPPPVSLPRVSLI